MPPSTHIWFINLGCSITIDIITRCTAGGAPAKLSQVTLLIRHTDQDVVLREGELKIFGQSLPALPSR